MSRDWEELLATETVKPYFKELQRFVQAQRTSHVVYPAEDLVLNALRSTSYEATKVLLLGQDPYHGPHQAHGLSFSVQPGTPLPPSLRNIFREREDDVGIPPSAHGCLQHWAVQGVLLLNTVLTVRAGEAGSHHGKGWETFTDAVIDAAVAKTDPVVFILWGENARKKKRRITGTHHTIIESAHPSPLSARHGFFGSKPFSRTNSALRAAGLTEIDWSLPPVPTISND